MKATGWARSGSLCVALGLLVAAVAAAPRECLAQNRPEAGTREYRAAAGLQKSGEYELAAQSWSEFLDKYATHTYAPQAALNLGICYLKSDKPKKAKAAFEGLLRNKPKPKLREVTLLYLGVSQYNLARSGETGSYTAADATFKRLVEEFPQSKYAAQAIFYRGECLYAMGKKKESAVFYSRLVKEYPKSPLVGDALYALGVAQEELEQYRAAGAAYDEFIKRFAKSPLYVEVTMRRGETLYGIKEYAAAAEWFAFSAGRKGFALADHSTMRRAASLAQLKKHAQAGKLYASVAEKFPKSKHIEEANLAGGKCYYLSGDMPRAEGLLHKAAASGGQSSAQAAHWLARCLLKQNKPAAALAAVKKALAAVEKALPKAGKSPWADRLAMDRADAVFDIPKRRGEAAAMYADVAKKFPKSASAATALYMAGFVALESGDYQTAARAAADFLKKFPDDKQHTDKPHLDKPHTGKLRPDVLSIAAESELQLGQFAEAEKLFGELVEKYSKGPDAEAWKVRLALAAFLQKKYARTIKLIEPRLGEIRSPAALAEAQYLLGSSRSELKQYAAAVKSLSASIEAGPAWRQADDTLLALANAYRQKGDLDEAVETCRRLLNTHPQSRLLDRASYWLGECAYAKGDFKTAAGAYRATVDKWPKSPLRPHALYGLAWSQLGMKDYAAVEKTVGQLCNEFPQSNLIPRAKYARGTARQQLGKYAAAIGDIGALLAAKPAPAERSDALYVLGLAQAGLKKNGQAAATFKKLLDENPKYPGADKVLYELAWALKSGDGDKAARRFAQLAKQYPNSPLAAESLYHVGENEYAKKNYDEAALSYHEAADRAAGKGAGNNGTGDKGLKEKAYHKLGWAYFNAGKLDDARQTFDYQYDAFPEGRLAGDAAFMHGECLFKMGKHAEALAVFEKVDKTTGKDFGALALLHAAQAAAQLKQWEKCRAAAAKAAQKFPDSTYRPEILCEQGWAEQNLGNHDSAIKLYSSVLDITDREVAARAQFLIGEIFFAQKKYAEAVKTFSKVIYGYSYPRWQADATFEAARCFETMGKKKQAAKYYNELVTRYPESDKADVARLRGQRIDDRGQGTGDR